MTTGHPLPSSTSSLRDRVAQRLNPIFRKGILAAAHNRPVAAFVRRFGMRLGAANFVAGETFDEAVVQIRALNDRGFLTNTTLLGEAITSEAAVERVVRMYRDVIDRIVADGLRTSLSVKLTQLGLDLGEDVARRNVEDLARYAGERGIFVRIDMEESSRVDATLRIYRWLRDAGHDNVGTVLQSYLYRTPGDLDALLPLRPNLRLVKGAYLEPESVAYPKKSDNDAAYLRLAERMLRECPFTAIATHDDRISERVIAFTEANHIPQERFQFQMLYGIRTGLQNNLLGRGYPVLIATPFGTEWYAFFMRRLAERPANVLFFLRSLVRR